MQQSSLETKGASRIAKSALSAAITIAGLLAMTASAGAYTARVKSACKSDYYRFCPKYGEDSPQLKACMRSAGGNISVRCRDALADGGYIPRKYHSSNLGR